MQQLDPFVVVKSDLCEADDSAVSDFLLLGQPESSCANFISLDIPPPSAL